MKQTRDDEYDRLLMYIAADDTRAACIVLDVIALDLGLKLLPRVTPTERAEP